MARFALFAAGAATALVAGLVAIAPASAAGESAVFSQDSAWGSGYQGKYTITAGTTALAGWKLEFDLPGATMGSFWDATLTSSGNHHTFTNREYNGNVSAGASTSFGFLVSGSAVPSNCKLNGVPCGGGTPPTSTTTTTPTTTTTSDVPPTPGSARVAPYIDITMPTPSLLDVANATGQKHFTLAFALGSSAGCAPAWGGTVPLNDSRIVNDAKALKAQGGSVIVATGGAMGPYLEHVCSTADSLYNAYVAVLDAVGSNSIDVDVEATIPQAIVNTALKKLQTTRGTTVSYTMRIQGQDYGMDPYSVDVLKDAAAKGLDVLVNPMLMNFGYTGNWGDAMVAASNATLGQMRAIWPSKSDAQLKASLGLTPMIGRNDTGPTTTQADARKVVDYAKANHVGRIAFWSAGRDNGSCPGGGVSPTCSGISQANWEFTNLFKTYTG
ncbi:cellulose binding domain-containing protein [Lentzea sp. BCCO 10_0856]|uniref:Cellulose binding domain-containing protein n=1 Tax=Lentzea miocenica TaxID=3095431 RepID=A0ABU4SY38_9PSEU|nr:cellulose binding domain-containing protein [Lentzea sp. BCCO 10_0856]MDX8030802.1 cellulose binding domain-containing protein [Lentzea sp. BCCO 10_0856]